MNRLDVHQALPNVDIDLVRDVRRELSLLKKHVRGRVWVMVAGKREVGKESGGAGACLAVVGRTGRNSGEKEGRKGKKEGREGRGEGGEEASKRVVVGVLRPDSMIRRPEERE